MADRPACCARDGNSSRNDSRSARSATRSGGRRGPATLGSTVDRSSSSVSSKSGPGPGQRHRPCSLAYASTRATSSASRPVSRRYASVSSSTGNSAVVAPYSGDMLAMVARSASASEARPSPANSTYEPTTPCARSIWLMTSTRSVAVVPRGSSPVSRTPTTWGRGWYSGWPSRTASASMPPTPKPSTPRPEIIVVCESVPTSVSGNASVSPSTSRVWTTRARYSRLTWWTMPVPGGTTRRSRNAV